MSSLSSSPSSTPTLPPSQPARGRSHLIRVGWLAGLPVLALIAAAAHLGTTRVTERLERQAAEIAAATGEGQPEPWLRVSIKGRDLTAAGEAPEATQREAVIGRLAGIQGLRRLDDRTGVIEEASPFVWSVERPAADRVEANGSRPAEVGAFELAQRLKPALPRDTTLSDRARAARGAPRDFPDAAAFAVERLQDLTTGAVATLNDTVISIRGEAASLAAYDALRTALANPPQGYTLGTVEILPPVVGDFRFSIARRPDGSLELNGHVASEGAREEIRAAAAEAAEGAAVDDRMHEARGLPQGVDGTELARFVFRLAALLHEGRVDFEGATVSVEGNALDAGAVGEAEALMREGRPAGIAAGRVALTARPIVPYVLRIRRGADSVTVSGHLPDQATREALLARLNPRFFRESIQDRTRLASGAPAGLAAALAAAVDPLSTLASGELTVTGTDLRLTGTSLYPESAARLRRALPQALPSGWSTTVSVSAGEPVTTAAESGPCGQRLAARTAGNPLRFAPGSTALAPEFYPVLDAVAALARACPGERIEVVGHLDPAGAKPETRSDPVTEEAAKETAPKPAKADSKTAKEREGKGRKGKTETRDAAKSEPKTEPKPEKTEAETAEAGADLARARALAVVDYLQKAGVPLERAAAPTGVAPLSDRQGIGLSLRS
ncbi:flagellar motor protein MotB [Methylorubrum populi]|uniref:OmpA/MotB domain n=1 Tax=Methylorubrum populi TaxID=223967 RepID=A0A833MXD1_9HYPH|nr:flagellar motor protein MotB [Methylorubrum populi]KAB7785172.1 OmpA/MotB domain precursor [Methylorubrum populi]